MPKMYKPPSVANSNRKCHVADKIWEKAKEIAEKTPFKYVFKRLLGSVAGSVVVDTFWPSKTAGLETE